MRGSQNFEIGLRTPGHAHLGANLWSGGKSLPDKFKNVIIAHDMTKKEREQCKVLVENAKFKTENAAGEWIYRVRGPPGRMKIVQFRTRQMD